MLMEKNLNLENKKETKTKNPNVAYQNQSSQNYIYNINI